eukprot:6160093-Alexandrium_andersonii.AAC.1
MDACGLMVAARTACRRGRIAKGMKRKLERVDIAYAIDRRINVAKVSGIARDLSNELQAGNFEKNEDESS